MDWFFKRSNEPIKWARKIVWIIVSISISLTVISSWNVKRREWLTYFYTKKYLIVLLISLSLSYATDEVDNLRNSSWHSPYFYPSLHSKVNSNPLFPKDLIQVFSNPSSTSYGQPNQMLFIYSIFLSQQLAPHSCTDLFWYPGLLTTLPNFQLWIYSSLLEGGIRPGNNRNSGRQ